MQKVLDVAARLLLAAWVAFVAWKGGELAWSMIRTALDAGRKPAGEEAEDEDGSGEG